VTGAKVTAIGDSVMLASAQQLHSQLRGIYIDAAVSRQLSAGLAAVQALARRGELRQVVVVGLGTNGTVTGGQVRQLRAAIGPHRWLVLINTYEARPWQDEVNAMLAAAARRYPRVLLVDWHAAITDRTRLLWDDGVHPRPSGAALYARLVKAAVRAAAAGQPQAGQPQAGQPQAGQPQAGQPQAGAARPPALAPPALPPGSGAEARAG
jgi:lysophospholipase L1-like esterase